MMISIGKYGIARICPNFSAAQTFHHPRHFQRRLRRFRAADHFRSRHKRKWAEQQRIVESPDIYPPPVELCGLPKQSEIEGESLAPLLKNPSAKWDRFARNYPANS